MAANNFIYRVAFREPPVDGEPETEFYFSSLSAIYETFTPAEIGCKVSRLWNIKVSEGIPYEGRLCRISRVPITAKKRNKPVCSVKNSSGDKLHA